MPAEVIRKPEQLGCFTVRRLGSGRLPQILNRFRKIALSVISRAHFERQALGGGVAGLDSLKLPNGLINFPLLDQLSRPGKLSGRGRSRLRCRRRRRGLLRKPRRSECPQECRKQRSSQYKTRSLRFQGGLHIEIRAQVRQFGG